MIVDIKSWLSKTKRLLFRIAFYIQYYGKRTLFLIKRRLPTFKKLHIHSFPAIVVKKLDWADFIVKFSAEILVFFVSILVAGLNIFFFFGSHAANYQDLSLANDFLSNHANLNQQVYAKNNTIETVVSGSGFFVPQAEAEFSGLDSQGIGGDDQSGSSSSTDPSNTLNMGDDSTILSPNPDSVQGLIKAQVTIYQTAAGDTLGTISQKFNISEQSLIWTNNLPNSSIQPGWFLLIPPINGVVVKADTNTTLPDIAEKYNPQRYNPNYQAREDGANQLLQTILSYNALTDAQDINPGQIVIVPGGVIATPPPSSVGTPKNYAYVPPTSRIDVVTSISNGYDGNNHYFPEGYCTYYVASRMTITFGGNAINWLANARASGYATGKAPASRSAVVMTGPTYEMRRYGHVAYVDSVNGNGTITISEMNYDHFNRVDTRTISVNDPQIRGYVYP
jgi:surface antigen